MKDLKTEDESAITVNNKSTEIINRNGFYGTKRKRKKKCNVH